MFIKNQVEIRPHENDKENKYFFTELDLAFGKYKNWYRDTNEVW